MITYIKFGLLALDVIFNYEGEQYQKIDDPTGSGMIFNAINITKQTYIQFDDNTIVEIEN